MGLGKGLRIYISDMFSSDTDAVGLGATWGQSTSRSVSSQVPESVFGKVALMTCEN